MSDLLAWYARHGRAHLPWRRTRDPYRIVVSEFMLQQTQVDRVLPLFRAFVERWPTFEALASSSAGDVVRAWRGLGYNSRAVRLRDLARAVVDRCGGTLPRERDALLALPGIGPYTASAIRAFAFDCDDAALDTNVRRIVHRVALGLEHPPLAAPAHIDRLAREMVERGRGHDWNSAMMDLGATVCSARAPKCLICPLHAGCAAAPVDAAQLAERARTATPRRGPQAALRFEETTRYLRGRVVDALRDLETAETLTIDELRRALGPAVGGRSLDDLPAVVDALASDGLVAKAGNRVCLA